MRKAASEMGGFSHESKQQHSDRTHLTAESMGKAASEMGAFLTKNNSTATNTSTSQTNSIVQETRRLFGQYTYHCARNTAAIWVIHIPELWKFKQKTFWSADAYDKSVHMVTQVSVPIDSKPGLYMYYNRTTP